MTSGDLCQLYGTLGVARITAIPPQGEDGLMRTVFVEIRDGVIEVPEGHISVCHQPTERHMSEGCPMRSSLVWVDDGIEGVIQ